MKKFLAGTICSVLVLAGAYFAYEQFVLKAADAAENSTTPVVRPIPTYKVMPSANVGVSEFPGVVRAEQHVELGFSVEGQLMELNATEGSFVKKGDVLARLDPRDFKSAADRAAAQYKEARQTLERMSSLRRQNVSTQSELDSAQAAYDAAEAEKRIREKALHDTVLYAPFDGVVSKRFVENHEHVKAKVDVVSFHNTANIQVVFQVPERQIANAGSPDDFDFSVQFDVNKNHWYSADMHEIRAEADASTGTYDEVVTLAPPNDITLYPGMTATVRVSRKQDALADNKHTGSRSMLVPVESVFGGSDGDAYVWVIRNQAGTPVKTKVSLGTMRDDSQEILSGLAEGQLVAVAGVHTITEKTHVRPMAHDAEGLN